ncbi:MAG: hypothetical protein LBN09_07245 [Clostridioides sp.]|jgi:hypothetical protein|nr:hypothetical protein [Clostridioides sp.]
MKNTLKGKITALAACGVVMTSALGVSALSNNNADATNDPKAQVQVQGIDDLNATEVTDVDEDKNLEISTEGTAQTIEQGDKITEEEKANAVDGGNFEFKDGNNDISFVQE